MCPNIVARRASSRRSMTLFGVGVQLIVGIIVFGSGTREVDAAWTSQGAVDPVAPANNNMFAMEGVAISGDLAIVGEPMRAVSSVSNTGAAYAFKRSSGTWSSAVALTPTAYVGGEHLGMAVDIDEYYAVVGAQNENDGSTPNAGAAHVFVYDVGTQAWTVSAKLVASSRNSADSFGSDVAISGDTIVIGVPGSSSGSGQVIPFERSGTSWSRQTAIAPTDLSANDGFGNAVAIDGNTMIVGCGSQNSGAGAAYIYTRTSATSAWTLEQKITLSGADASNYDELGARVAVSGDTVAIVSRRIATSDFGAVFVYTRTSGSWSRQTLITPPTGAVEFADSMALNGDLLVAGAPDTDLTTGNAEGAAYVFQRDSSGNWNQLVRLEAHDGSSANTQNNAAFGSAVGIHGNTVIVGARGYSSNKGRAYIYQDASVTNNGSSANCDASTAPTNGGVGSCTNSLASGSTCQPTCDSGYTVSGTSSCTAGTLTAATCNVLSPSPPPNPPPPSQSQSPPPSPPSPSPPPNPPPPSQSQSPPPSPPSPSPPPSPPPEVAASAASTPSVAPSSVVPSPASRPRASVVLAVATVLVVA